MHILVRVALLLGKLVLKLLKPIFNKYVRKALWVVIGPIWVKFGRPIWQRTGAPICRKIWGEAPRRVKVRKVFESLGDCPGCGEFARHRVERVGSIVMIAKKIPGPSVGASRLRAVCVACGHERPVADERRAVGTVEAALDERPSAAPPEVT